MMRKILASVLALVSLLSLVHLGRATLPGPRGPDVVASQVSHTSGHHAIPIISYAVLFV